MDAFLVPEDRQARAVIVEIRFLDGVVVSNWDFLGSLCNPDVPSRQFGRFSICKWRVCCGQKLRS